MNLRFAHRKKEGPQNLRKIMFAGWGLVKQEIAVRGVAYQRLLRSMIGKSFEGWSCGIPRLAKGARHGAPCRLRD